MPDQKETSSQSTGTTGSTIRPYRSKKQRPCDGCRKRRVGCFVENGEVNCTLCRHRGRACTFDTSAPVKKGRRPKGTEIESPTLTIPATTATTATSKADRLTTDNARSPEFGLDWTTIQPGRTVLYTGSSSDQDVYLLRHLPFDRHTSTFGTSSWRVSKVLADERAPAYFTSYPNDLLDADNSDIYDYGIIDRLFSKHLQRELLRLYFSFVHPSLPILEDLGDLEASIHDRAIPASLLAAIYYSTLPFWPTPGSLSCHDKLSLYEFIFRRISLEARTPSLRTVQAMLIYMQLPPGKIREPNHPGFWALTCQLVALAQDIGLHAEPSNWNMSQTERKTRRVLWWAVYMQDKWLAHWLGRPSHINDRQFNVTPLEMNDFISSSHGPSCHSSITAFVTLSHMTRVLAQVLDSFYTITHNPSAMSPTEALSHASQCQSRLHECASYNTLELLRPSRVGNDYAVVFAYYGIAASIQRALFACVGGTSYYDIQREQRLFEDLSNVIEDLLQQRVDGLWLSYCKSNLAVIGNFLITALLSSTDDEVYKMRRNALERFRGNLQRLVDAGFEFAALPLLRLNLLVERFYE